MPPMNVLNIFFSSPHLSSNPAMPQKIDWRKWTLIFHKWMAYGINFVLITALAGVVGGFVYLLYIAITS
jgi:hypothetical protein